MRKILTAFKHSPWYWRIKYSAIGRLLLNLLYPKLAINLQQEASLFQEAMGAIKKGFLVFDIGGNVGNNTDLFLKIGAKVVVLEPDKTNVTCPKARFGRNQNIHLVQKAVSNQEGTSQLFIEKKGAALHTLSTKWKTFLEDNDRWNHNVEFSHSEPVQTTTLSQLIKEFGQPDFIKIDVEGFEEKVIQGLDRPINQLCFEANLPQFTQPTIRSIKMLSDISKSATFNYSIEEKFELSEYVSPERMIDIVSTTKARYMDIFCKMD